jgi:hypothetical protein
MLVLNEIASITQLTVRDRLVGVRKDLYCCATSRVSQGVTTLRLSLAICNFQFFVSRMVHDYPVDSLED